MWKRLAVAVCVGAVLVPAPAYAFGLEAAAIAALAGVLGGTTAAYVAATIIVYGIIGGIMAGISYGIQAALAPTPKAPSLGSRVDNLRSVLRNNAAPARIGYGRNKTSGILLAVESTDHLGRVVSKGPYLQFGLAIAVGPITDIFNIELNDNEANTVNYSRRALFVPFMGYRDQPMLRGPLWLDKKLLLPEEWLKKYRPLREIAWCHNVLRFDPRVFPGGSPNVRYEWLGRPVYDPRRSLAGGAGPQVITDIRTWEYSTNPALCVRDWMTNRKFGRKMPDAAVCEDCLIQAANTCDEDVPAPTTSSSTNTNAMRKRYTCNGNWDASEKAIDILGKLLSTCAGMAHFYDGQWHIKAGTATLPCVDGATGKTVIWSPRTMRSGTAFAIQPRPGAKERVNTVTGLYINPNINFQIDTFPKITHPDFVADDGNIEQPEEIELNFTQDVDEARTLATILLKQARLSLRVTWPAMPMLQQHVPGQVVWVCLPFAGWGYQGRVQVFGATKFYAGVGIAVNRVPGDKVCFEGFNNATNNGTKTIASIASNDGFTVVETCTNEGMSAIDITLADKLFRIVDRQQNETGAVDYILAEYDDDIYVFEIDPSELPPPTRLPDPFKTGVPTNVAIEERTHINPDGTRVAALVVTWNPPLTGQAEAYRVRWRGVDAAGLGATGNAWQETTVFAPTTKYEIIGLPYGSYEIRVASRLNAITSDDVIVVAVVTYDALPPPSPINFRVRLSVTGSRQFNWDVGGDGIEPADLRGYQLRYVPGAIESPLTALTEWDTARPFVNGTIRGRDHITRAPTRPGIYTIMVRAIDKSGLYSNDVASLQIIVTPAVSDIVTQRSFGEEGWPGAIANGNIGGSGALEGLGDVTWADMPTWESVTTWGQGSRRPLIYTSDVIDLGNNMTVRAMANAIAVRHRGLRVEYAVRQDGADLFTTFLSRNTLTGRYVMVRCIVAPEPNSTGGACALHELSVTFTEELATLSINDYVMSSRPAVDAVIRTENDNVEWHNAALIWRIGYKQYIPGNVPIGTNPNNEPPRTALTVDNDPMFDSSGGIGGGQVTIPHNDVLNLQPPYTIELQGRIMQPGGVSRPIAVKSGAWSILWTAGTGIWFDFVGGTPIYILGVKYREFFHIAFVNTGGRFTVYFNGERSANITLNTAPPPISANALTLAKSGASTVDCYLGELRVWNVGRSWSDIRGWMTAPVPRTTPGLVGQWRLNDSGTTVFDTSPTNNHGTRSGGGRAYLLHRESIPMPLGIMPKTYAPLVVWNGDPTGAAETKVEASIDNGVNWVNIPINVVTAVTGLVGGTVPPAGATLRVRQYLMATNATARPTITDVTSGLAYLREKGDLIVRPPDIMTDLHQASVTAIQGSAGATAELVTKGASGARWRIIDGAGLPADAIVDIQFRGGKV